MKKTINVLENQVKNIDFFIEVIDARAIEQSSNQELVNVFKNKIKITIALKSDLIDIKKYQSKYPDILFCSIYNSQDRNKIIKHIQKKCEDKINNLIKKGYVNFEIHGIVIGLPNIGKSSLINFILNKKQLIVGNKPGVTKKVNWVKVNKNIYLQDTPGVFFKRVDDFLTGSILTIIKTVNFNIVNQYEVLKSIYIYINQKYDGFLNKYFNINNVDNDFNYFLEQLCITKKFIIKNNEYDFNRCFDYLYNLFDKKDLNIDFN